MRCGKTHVAAWWLVTGDGSGCCVVRCASYFVLNSSVVSYVCKTVGKGAAAVFDVHRSRGSRKGARRYFVFPRLSPSHQLYETTVLYLL